MSITAVLKEIASVERFFESRDDSGDVSGLQKSFADSVPEQAEADQGLWGM